MLHLRPFLYFLLVAAIIIFLQGCVTTIEEVPPPLVAPKTEVSVDPRVLLECKSSLDPVPIKNYSELDFVSKVIPVWVSTYNECRDLNSAKLRILENAFRLSDESQVSTSSNQGVK